MKKIFFMMTILVFIIAVLNSTDFTNFSSINNIFDAYEATVVVKRITAADSTQGTGFFVSEDYVVTNATIVGNSRVVKINVRNTDYDAYVVAVHYYLDFALLKVEDYISFRYVTFTRFDQDMLDNRGTILNYNDSRITETTGSIITNSVIRDNNALFQIDATLPIGRINGPVLDQNHHLVGFLISDRNMVDTTQFIPGGIYLGVKSDYIIPIIQIYTKISIHYNTPTGSTIGLTGDPGLTLVSGPPNSSIEIVDRSTITSSRGGATSGRSNTEKNIPEGISIDLESHPDTNFESRNDGSRGGLDRDAVITAEERSRLERAEAERFERERQARERIQNERTQRQNEISTRLEIERKEKEKAEKERVQKENDRLDRERVESEQVELNRINIEKVQREQAIQKDRRENERILREQTERVRQERERIQRDIDNERERLQREQAIERERARQEQIQALEKERLQKEQVDFENQPKQNLEQANPINNNLRSQ